MARKPMAEQAIVALLAKGGELTVSEIARKLGLSKSTVSVSVRRLEEKGLVRRIKKGGAIIVRIASPIRGEPKPRLLRLGILRAVEYPFIIVFKKMLRENGLELDIRIYNNGVEALMKLINAEIDLALSPLPTEFYFYALTRSLHIIGGGAYGGATILRSKHYRAEKAYTTMISTMEACLNASGLSERTEKAYALSGEEILLALRNGMAAYAVLWEPYATRALRYGVPEVDCKEIGLNYCCTLAARRSIEPDLLEKISRIYRRALEEFRQRPYRGLEEYARIIGDNISLIKKSITRYSINEDMDPSEAEKTLRRAGISMPSPSLVRDAIQSF